MLSEPRRQRSGVSGASAAYSAALPARLGKSRSEVMHQPPLVDQPRESPRHGFQGDRGAPPPRTGPAAMTIAVSREAGARGGTIARRVGRKLGWQVYDQELL